MLYIGVDWADQKHDALALDEAGRKLGAIHVAHTAEGLSKLNAWLVQILGEADKEQMACIVAHKPWFAHYLLAGTWVASVSCESTHR
jgi:hypothetical protein